MPVCKSGDININYKVYGTGFPLVLTHGFSANLETWAPQVEDFSGKYQLIVYDTRGHNLSSAPAGAENYSLDIMVEDLHNLLTHLKVDKAFVGGLSMGGAVSLGYAGRHPEKVAAVLIFDIDGGFQPYDAETDAIMTKMREESDKIALERGMVDVARHRIATGTAFRPIMEDEALQEQYLERMAKVSINGYIGIGQALPWEEKWQNGVADNINIPALIVVGGDDEGRKAGARILHEHIKGSRYVEIKDCVHGTAEWRPDAFNPAVLEFLEAAEAGKSMAGEITLD